MLKDGWSGACSLKKNLQIIVFIKYSVITLFSFNLILLFWKTFQPIENFILLYINYIKNVFDNFSKILFF